MWEASLHHARKRSPPNLDPVAPGSQHTFFPCSTVALIGARTEVTIFGADSSDDVLPTNASERYGVVDCLQESGKAERGGRPWQVCRQRRHDCAISQKKPFSPMSSTRDSTTTASQAVEHFPFDSNCVAF